MSSKRKKECKISDVKDSLGILWIYDREYYISMFKTEHLKSGLIILF